MKTAIQVSWRFAGIVPLLLLACSHPDDETEALGTVTEELNGVYTANGNLTRKTFAEASEAARQNETQLYYNQVRIGKDGISGLNITLGLPTLQEFNSFYGIGANSPHASYYNRGDLGIGRDMHCVDRMSDVTNQQVACYVKNYGAGDNGSEFTFGQSANVAFKNMAAENDFATVAMVFRNLAPVKDKVFFVVYGANDQLQFSAALDRHGLNFANGKTDVNGLVGTPGVNFNNHIPSNCVSCHGGNSYDSATHSQTGTLFLPFDLDQFEYENVPGKTRADQLNAFRTLNEIVRKVAVLTANSPGGQGNPAGFNIRDQLDGWYNNTVKTGDATEIFENQFDSNFVPAGWKPPSATAEAETAYRSVVRRSCRGCHVAISGPRAFNDAATFNAFAGGASGAVADLCNFTMPHALQTVREFWQSSQPNALGTYLQTVSPALATELAGCSSRNVATLDPQHVMASTTLF